MQVLEDAGYTDMGGTRAPGEHTYLFGGLVGSLDHVLAAPAAASRVTGAHVWNINSVEPVALEYSRYNDNATDFYSPGPYRASDHDPLVVGLDAKVGQRRGHHGHHGHPGTADTTATTGTTAPAGAGRTDGPGSAASGSRRRVPPRVWPCGAGAPPRGGAGEPARRAPVLDRPPDRHAGPPVEAVVLDARATDGRYLVDYRLPRTVDPAGSRFSAALEEPPTAGPWPPGCSRCRSCRARPARTGPWARPGTGVPRRGGGGGRAAGRRAGAAVVVPPPRSTRTLGPHRRARAEVNFTSR